MNALALSNLRSGTPSKESEHTKVFVSRLLLSRHVSWRVIRCGRPAGSAKKRGEGANYENPDCTPAGRRPRGTRLQD